jgi:hypothetical protein
MGLHDLLGNWNTSYGQKKGWESNRQFDSQPLKVGNHLDFLTCRWRATYCWKSIDKGYNFALDLTSIGGSHIKLWAPKVAGVPTLGILGFQLGVLRPNDIWVLVPWPSIEYKGEGGDFPKFRLWWILWVCAPKCSNYALTNLLFGLCRSVWIIDLLVNLLVPIPEL